MPIKHNEEEFFPFEPEPDGEFFDTVDFKAVRGALWDLCKKQGYGGRPMEWPHRESFLSLLMQARQDAHEVAKKKGIDVEAAWSVTRKDVIRKVSDVLKSEFGISEWHDRIFRKYFAIASVAYPNDYRSRFELATQLVMDHADQRTIDAWFAYTMQTQESLFDDTLYYSEATGEGKSPLEMVPDETPTGRDPSYEQTSFLEHVLSDEFMFTEREKDIVELKAYEGMSNVQIAEKIDVDEWTVRNDLKKIRLKGVMQGWLPHIAEEDDEDEEPKDQALSS